MRIHFIAIGGSAMHNLALAMHHKGFEVTGSDDEIFEPARSRLASAGLLPAIEGWFPEKLDSLPDAVILGMHAKADNPELLRAKELNIKIFSYPEYLYEQSKDKKRVVVGGSHGKTTITAMILHVLKYYGLDFDYMVGAQLEGFDVMVRLTEKAPVMVIEGDEYLTSPIDRRPKFHLYRPDVAILSGIAWDHINVFPTFENYLSQFSTFIQTITPGGSLIYCKEDPHLPALCSEARPDIHLQSYGIPAHFTEKGITWLENDPPVQLKVFGKHNLMNINAARYACMELGITEQQFLHAIGSFGGAAKRLELIVSGSNYYVYKDFAHAPSKVQATLKAVKEQYPEMNVVACLELHTYSSLNQHFLSQYLGSLDAADFPVVYYNPHAIKLKQLPEITDEQIRAGFGSDKIEVFSDSGKLKQRLLEIPKQNTVFLMMSSGNYDGLDLKEMFQ